MIGLEKLRNDLTKLEEDSKAGKQLNKLSTIFSKITGVWELAKAELNSI